MRREPWHIKTYKQTCKRALQIWSLLNAADNACDTDSHVEARYHTWKETCDTWKSTYDKWEQIHRPAKETYTSKIHRDVADNPHIANLNIERNAIHEKKPMAHENRPTTHEKRLCHMQRDTHGSTKETYTSKTHWNGAENSRNTDPHIKRDLCHMQRDTQCTKTDP